MCKDRTLCWHHKVYKTCMYHLLSHDVLQGLCLLACTVDGLDNKANLILLMVTACFLALLLVRFGSLMPILLQTEPFLFLLFSSCGLQVVFHVFLGCYFFNLSQCANTPPHADLHIYGKQTYGLLRCHEYPVVLVP